MKNWQQEKDARIKFIQQTVKSAGANGVVLGLSGGKDSALAAILCSLANIKTLGLILPCQSKVNFTTDTQHALILARQFNIETQTADLTGAKIALQAALEAEGGGQVSLDAAKNIAPRLRMAALYAAAQTRGYLVAGTSNASEIFVGYFTKWGDAGADFNPIADLKASEVFEFLRFLKCPLCITEKAPSAGLFEGQTDEGEMGVSYAQIEAVMAESAGGGKAAHGAAAVDEAVRQKILKMHERTQHKRHGVLFYKG